MEMVKAESNKPPVLRDGFDVPKLNLNKLDSARRQLRTAIQLFFDDKDPVSIHCLASSAYRILRDLAEGSGDCEFHNSMMACINQGMKSQYWTAINSAANFFKHADRDPEETYAFNPAANDLLLILCCQYIQSREAELPAEGKAYTAWVLINYPNLISKDSLLWRFYQTMALSPASTREEALVDGREMLRHLQSLES